MLMPTAALSDAMKIEMPVVPWGMFRWKPPSNEKGRKPRPTAPQSMPLPEKLHTMTTAAKAKMMNQTIALTMFSKTLTPRLPLP